MDESGRGPDEMPSTIGRYQVQNCIGFGAMGAVYKAFDPLIKRTLAIKTIRLDIPRNSPQYRTFIDRFYHEARISGTLSHANIVTLFDIGEEAGLPYLAMEFVEGETIAEILGRGVRFRPERVVGLVGQVASAVDYAHTKSVIHRDIKPSNLILSDGDRVKVTDFGIAKVMGADLTAAGQLLGTPSYMSPEQAMGDPLDGRTDIFSLGVCAFEMLSGEQPFPGNNVTSILYKLVHVDPIEPANLEMNGLVPQRWHEVFGKVLAKKPAERYQTAGAFVQDLEDCLGWAGAGSGAGARPSPPTAASFAAADEEPAPTIRVSAGSALPAAPPPAVAEELPATALLPTALAEPEVPATQLLPVQPAADAALPADVEIVEEPETIVMDSPAEVYPTVALPAAAAGPALAKAIAPPPADEPGPTAELPVVTSPRPPLPPPPPPTAAIPVVKPAAPPPRSAPPPPPRPGVAPPSPATAPTRLAPQPAAPSPPATARSRVPTPGGPGLLLIALGGLLFLLAGAVMGWIIVNRASAPTPAPPTTVAATPAPATTLPAPTRGEISVESEPPGARVLLDGEPRGTTPVSLPDLALGDHEVVVELPGHEAQTVAVTLAAEAPRSELRLTLVKAQPTRAALDVVSNPPGAVVRVDDTTVGWTPLRGHSLKPGEHRVEVAKEGFQTWSGKVTAVAGRRARIERTLEPVPAATPPPTTAPAAPEVDPSRVYPASEVDRPPRKVSGESPPYPSKAPRLRSGDSVSTLVGFVVTEQGEVTDLVVEESGGRLLDEAVLEAMRTWRYEPGVKRGVKVKTRMRLKKTYRGG